MIRETAIGNVQKLIDVAIERGLFKTAKDVVLIQASLDQLAIEAEPARESEKTNK